MSDTDATAQTIMDRVRATLSPTRFSLKNESHLHKGHRGNKDGGGHYDLYIVSDAFDGLSSLQRNRWVMELLKDLFSKKEIHAIKLKLKTEAEVPFLEAEGPQHTYGRNKAKLT